MVNIISLALENEMDLVLAHKRSMKLAERVGLTNATQTTFATAVSEVSRTVIEHTQSGILKLGLIPANGRYSLQAVITFQNSETINLRQDGFYYAQKLVPEFEVFSADGNTEVLLSIGIPRSLKIDNTSIKLIKEYFSTEAPINAYEEIKLRNISLSKLNTDREEEIKQSKLIDEKKNEFISMASHELKTPITVIKAYTQIIKGLKKGCSDQVHEIVDRVDYQVSKLQSLVQQLLDVSKIENGHLVYSKELVPFSPFVVEMVAVLQNISPNNEISVKPCEDVLVMIDRLRMEQVFSNLLGNAAKYSAPESVIRVESKIIDEKFVQISVSDSGIGMSELTMKSVFDKFYRDKDVLKNYSGLGMGLYITSKIVTDHGGEIWVDSKEGVGSVFSFKIPYESKINFED